MSNARTVVALAILATLVLSSVSQADFSGQPILGPLSLGSSVNGDTTGAADDNDGWTSGFHFFDLWHGPDDVWQLNWAGGDLKLELSYNAAAYDLDVFLYRPTNLDDSGDYGITNNPVDTVMVFDAPAGTYYINVDGAGTDAGAYTLSILPEPASLGVLAMGLLLMARRTRKAI